ncbi:MAG: hypothetical protein CME80_21275 [Halomonas sp.]|nr:hypothetical protein [Halomonas sp.]MBF60218.1 hypothetical protein [Halomonas sp.]|tara:strand:+ start:1262 stop:1813 length:552 start_codon:yes stop_codon:yes gene_type:complete
MKEEDVQHVFEKVSKTVSIEEIFHDSDVGSRAVWSALTELLFLLTPLLLVAFVLALHGGVSVKDFLSRSDISLLATFVFGQAAIKAFKFPQDTFVLKGAEAMSGLVALIVCLGMLPSAALFSFATVFENTPMAVIWIQPFLLVLSIIIYAGFAFVSNAANIIRFEGSRTIVARALDELNARKT